MRLQRLGWAGLEIECDGESLVIDYVQDKSPMAPFLRDPVFADDLQLRVSEFW